MVSKKISQLNNGGALLPSDFLAIERASTNFKAFIPQDLRTTGDVTFNSIDISTIFTASTIDATDIFADNFYFNANNYYATIDTDESEIRYGNDDGAIGSFKIGNNAVADQLTLTPTGATLKSPLAATKFTTYLASGTAYAAEFYGAVGTNPSVIIGNTNNYLRMGVSSSDEVTIEFLPNYSSIWTRAPLMQGYVTGGNVSNLLLTGDKVILSGIITEVTDDFKLSALTANRIIATDGSKSLTSVVVSGFIAGTASQVIVTDDGDGTATLSLPQNIATDSSPTFGKLTLQNMFGTTFNVDDTGRLTLSDGLGTTNLEVDFFGNLTANGTGSFNGITDRFVSDANRGKLMATNNDKVYVPVNISSYIAGTSNQVTVTDDGDGTVTLSLPQNIATGSSPTFAGLNLSGLTASRAVVTDASKNLASLQYTNTNTVSTLVQRDSNGDFAMRDITLRNIVANANLANDIGSASALFRNIYATRIYGSNVASSSATLGLAFSTTASDPRITLFGPSYPGYEGMIEYNVPTGARHIFRINNSDKMTLNATGLAVNKSTASYALDVSGTDIALTGSSSRLRLIDSATNGRHMILASVVGDGSGDFHIYDNTSARPVLGYFYSTNVIRMGNTSTKVGIAIGSNTTLHPLHVNGTIGGGSATTPFTLTSGGSDLFLNTGASTSTIYLRPNGSGSSVFQVYFDTSIGTRFLDGSSTEGFRISPARTVGALGTRIMLTGGGSANASVAIDLNPYDVTTNPNITRIQAIDDGNFSADLVFYTKTPGATANALAQRMRISSALTTSYNSLNAPQFIAENSTQLTYRILLSGQEFYQPGNTSTSGLALLLGVNRTNSRQLWIADGNALTQNTTNSVIRLAVGGTATPTIDAIATDGVTPKTLNINPGGGTVNFGGSVGWAGQTTFDANTRLQGPNSSSARAKAFAWDTYSDERLKTDIKPYDIEECLRISLSLTVDGFYWKNGQGDNYDNRTPQKQIGYIAQKAALVSDLLVSRDDDGIAVSVNHGQASVFHTGAIQALYNRITALENQLNQLTVH